MLEPNKPDQPSSARGDWRADNSIQVHATALVESGARIGARCVIHPHAIVSRHCELGEDVVVHPFAVLGGPPQDIRFDSKIESGVRIGARTVIREHVTVNRATKADTYTQVGADCFLMTACHVAHDCHVGNRVIIANAVLMGGHVHIGDRAFLGGGAVIHQFCRIGEDVMIGGGARVSMDVAPYCMATERNTIIGLNVVGLRRSGMKRDVMSELKIAFRILGSSVGNPRSLAADLLRDGRLVSVEARRFLEFFQTGKRAFVRSRRAADIAQDNAG
jgi:UDP-N-acetylglucosamine acyltransferase